jgi:V/A-type H+-transporting ATPase subunit K
MAVEQVANSLLTGASGAGIGAGLAIGLAAIGAGISQSALGSAAIGVAAERPEFESKVLLYIALPELLVYLNGSRTSRK